MKLLAIDPGSHKTGLAFFEDGILKGTTTVTTKHSDPVKRRFDILSVVATILPEYDVIVSEAPTLQGYAANGMQRFLGVLEFLTQGKVNFYHPMSIKKHLGGGAMEKLDMALEAGRRVMTEAEQEIIADAITAEAFDETDAVCAGLTYLEGEHHE